MTILLSAHKLSISFAGRTLFKDISLGVDSDDHIGLIGPNGAGKSTLLKILAGRVKPDSGTLSTQQGLRVAFLEQNPVINPESTVMETIMEGADDPHDWEAMAKAHEMLSKLQFEEAGVSEDTLMSALSGGWKKKAALAREYLRNPKLLILDEPTNHLDVESIFWLEEFLSEAPFATLTVTHDRLFLNRISKKIWELDYRNQNGLLVVEGDYVDYCEVKENLMHAQERQEDTMKNVLRRETEWLRKGPKARSTKQQARIDRAGELAENVAELSELNRKREVKLDFVGAEKNPKKLIEATKISKAYGDKQVIKDFSLFLSPGSRVGLLGINGAGKSTLLRMLLGIEAPDTGKVELADALEVSYFEQNRESLDPNMTVMQTICPQGDHVKFNGNYVHIRSYLDRFLFNADKAVMPVSKLSGGEQSRLLIARLMLKESNVLVLDEPTNDLDMLTLNILEDRLKEFTGAVLLVTHDRYFMHRVATKILAIDQYFDKGHVESFSNLEQWEAWQKVQIAKENSNQKNASKSAASSSTHATKSDTQVEPKKNKGTLGPKEQHELKNMEATIQKAEASLEALQAQSVDPQNLSNSSRMKDIYKQLADVQLEVERLYKRWAELEALK